LYDTLTSNSLPLASCFEFGDVDGKENDDNDGEKCQQQQYRITGVMVNYDIATVLTF